MIFNPTPTATTYQRIIREVKDVYPPTVYITTDALLKMKSYIESCDKEIAWLCVVEKEDSEVYTITDTILFKQDITASTADICEVALNDFATELASTGRMDLFNKIKGWGHSHVNMAVFASGTDESTFKDFYSTCDYFIRIIGNKPGLLKLDFVDCEKELRFDNIVWKELMSPEQTQIEAMIQAFNKKYEEKKQIINAETKAEMEKKVFSKTTVVNSYQDYKAKKEEEEKKSTVIDKKKDTREDDDETYYQQIADLYATELAVAYLEDYEILEYDESFYTWNDLRMELSINPLFDDFNIIDWKELWESIQSVASELRKGDRK